MSDINNFDAMTVIILTGDISRRIRKYDTDEERQGAKVISYKKYAAKK